MKTTTTKQPIQMNNENKHALRILVRAREDFQAQRKRMDNRIGRKADKTSQNISDGRNFAKDDVETFVGIADSAKEQEKQIQKKLKEVLKRFDIYNEWLKDVKGVGEIAASHLIGTINIYEASTVSKIWQYCGLNPSKIRGKKRVKTTKPKTYEPTNPDWEVVKRADDYVLVLTDELIRGDKLQAGFVSPFNKGIKSALLGVLASGFIKAGIRYEDASDTLYEETSDTYRRIQKGQKQIMKTVTCPYCELYLNYKERLLNSNKITNHRKGGKVLKMAWKDVTPGHRDMAAKRYMIKMFLADLYNVWRGLEGLEVRKPYQEEYLGHKHTG